MRVTSGRLLTGLIEQAPATAASSINRETFFTGCRVNVRARIIIVVLPIGRTRYIVWSRSLGWFHFGCVFRAVSGAAFGLEHAVGTVLIEDGFDGPCFGFRD